MSGSRDRLGLLLPLPALLAVGPAAAHAEALVASSQDEAPASDEGLDDTALPPVLREEAREAFERGEQAFERGEYVEAATAFEHAAELAPELVVLWLDAVISLRYAVLDQTEPEPASELCDRLRRDAEVVREHPRATPEMRERASAELDRGVERCNELEASARPCLSVVEQPEVEHGPCLTPPHDDEPKAGCAHRKGDVAVLGLPLVLLGLRSRRRRDAVERMADRLPADVMARLRRDDDEPGDG